VRSRPDRARPFARRVEPQAAGFEEGRAIDSTAPGDGAQPGEQLGEGERLRQVVVGAAVEPGDPVADRVARGQHHDRRPDSLAPQHAADLEAVDPRQHDVEDDRVVLGRRRHPQSVLTPDRDVGGDALGDEAPPQQGGHLDLVLDDQDSHELILR
jgi:hypothetical protein